MNYLHANQNLWNSRTETHLGSDFYDLSSFEAGRSSLKPIELEYLGDVSGKSILHAQCHFGQDSLSLARMGAQVTGVDLSDRAIAEARKLNDRLGLNAQFIQSDVQQMDQHITETFDWVFASYGCIGWLPSLQVWGQQIAKRLKPGGQFLFVEFHPAVWMFNDQFTQIEYSYFNVEPMIEHTDTSYTENAKQKNITSYYWNHSLGDVFQALIQAGLQVDDFQEYDYSPWNCFESTIPAPNGWYLEGLAGKLPMIFAILVSKPISVLSSSLK